MRPQTRFEQFIDWLTSKIHGDTAYSWRNVVANRISRYARKLQG